MNARRTVVAAFATLALAAGPQLFGADQPAGSLTDKKEDVLKLMAAKVGLNEQQEAQVRTILGEFDKREEPVIHQLWSLHHQEKAAMREVLTPEQRDKVPQLMKHARDAMFQEFATTLNLDAQQKEKIEQIREQYGPKYRELAADKEENGSKFQELRHAEFAAISKELNDQQKAKLPAFMKEEFKKWRDPKEQAEHLQKATKELGLSNDQQERLKKIQADFTQKAEQPAAQLKQLFKDERAAVEKVLTPDQRTKLTDLVGSTEE